jgi:hypothetical protein
MVQEQPRQGRECRGRRKKNNKQNRNLEIYVENRSPGPPSGGGSSARRGTCSLVV